MQKSPIIAIFREEKPASNAFSRSRFIPGLHEARLRGNGVRKEKKRPRQQEIARETREKDAKGKRKTRT
jgi:hypothetical protein